ncbi:MAG: Rrf2 family transcriptional regulator [Bryobacteraceae bacterium]|nr:Rrf2 family transcriptional regulator [Bryobacteraceae bacterium]
MRLTAYTDYSLRVLMYLGLKNDALATIGEISEAYGISSNHLMKIIHNLAKLGYIKTIRGRGGGMKLAGEPQEINLGQFVRQVEPDFAIVECFEPRRRHECVITPACRLQVVLGKAVQSFLDVLDQYTLADLLQDATRLKSLLHIERARLDADGAAIGPGVPPALGRR